MAGGVLGVIVAGGGAPLNVLGMTDDAALTPFGGKYRFIDFALATLLNSGVSAAYVVAPGPNPALDLHLARIGGAPRGHRIPELLPLTGPWAPPRARAARLIRALGECRELVEAHKPETIVVLLADHILQLDLRQLSEAHHDSHADLTLAALPVPVGEAANRTVLRITGDQRVQEVQSSPVLPATTPGCRSFALSWAGDLVLSAAALSRLLAVASLAVRDDAAVFGPLTDLLRVMAYDVLESRLPGCPPGLAAYWHEPTTLEAYYEAQMDLCTPHPALDLYNPAWPVLPLATGLGPAKVVADAAGRAGQALNSLVSDGSVIRGGVAVNTVMGHGVMIESAAEVEDSVLLDGCRIGRGARVRRAVVAAGAVIGEGEEIGYGSPPRAPARVVDSGLTLVPALPRSDLAAAASAR